MRRMEPSRSDRSWPRLPGIAARAPITQAEIQEAVGSERDLSAVVVGDGCAAVRITVSLAGSARSGSAETWRRDKRSVASQIGIMDHETPVGRVVRIEGQAEQPLLAHQRRPARSESRNGASRSRPLLYDPDTRRSSPQRTAGRSPAGAVRYRGTAQPGYHLLQPSPRADAEVPRVRLPSRHWR